MTGQSPPHTAGSAPKNVRDAVINVIESLNGREMQGYKLTLEVSDYDLQVQHFITKPDESGSIKGKSYKLSAEKDGEKTGLLDFRIAGDDLNVVVNSGADKGKAILKAAFSAASQNGQPVAVNKQGHTLDVLLGATALQKIESILYDITPM